MTQAAAVALGEIADLQAGVGFPQDLQGRTSGDYPVAKVGDISRVGRAGEAVINTADHFVDKIDLVRLKARPIPMGSVLFAKIGEAIRQNHRVIAGCELLIDNNAMAAIPTERVESRYLFHFLRTVDFYGLASATTVPALRKSDLQRLPVPLPPLPEQRRIAEILDKADALRAKRRATLARLDTLTQSVFLDMFGDPRTISPATSVPLQDFCRILQGGRLGLSGNDFVPQGFPAYGAGGINGYLPRYEFDEPAVVLSAIGARCGKCFFAEGKWISLANTQLIFPDPNRANCKFLWYELNDEGRWHRSGTGQPFIKPSDVKAHRAFLPPLAKQNVFCARTAVIDKAKVILRRSLEELDALFVALQQCAFRGEL